MKTPLLSCLLVLGCVGVAEAQVVDKYNITPAERAACEYDATTLCSTVYPDEDALISCMRTNQENLSPVCRKFFIAGLQRRHM